tara:strand:+ start:12218 stop:13105 length:888 start_codon:yes stop_codon:yes gene_type:complete
MKKLKLDLSKSINRLKIITQRLVTSNLVGGYLSVFRGRGLEFQDFRKYDQGDDATLIDWKASLKSNQLLIKEFVEERNLNVFFLIDVSNSMVFSTTDKLKIEYAAELIATLSNAITSAGDSIGYAFFNDKVTKHVPPSQGMKRHFQLIKALVDPRDYGGKYDLTEALRFTLSYLKQFSVVIVVSDFIGLKNHWKNELKVVGKKFDLIGVMIRDPVEEDLPDYNGRVTLGDVFSNKQIVVDTYAIKDQYKKQSELFEKEVHKAFNDSGSDFIKLNTEESFIKPLTDLFFRRSKRHG